MPRHGGAVPGRGRAAGLKKPAQVGYNLQGGGGPRRFSTYPEP